MDGHRPLATTFEGSSTRFTLSLFFPSQRIAVDRFVQDIPRTPGHRTWAVLERLEANLERLADKPTTFVWG